MRGLFFLKLVDFFLKKNLVCVLDEKKVDGNFSFIFLGFEGIIDFLYGFFVDDLLSFVGFVDIGCEVFIKSVKVGVG